MIAIAVLAAALAVASRWHHDLSIDEPFMARAVASPGSIPQLLADDNVPLAYLLFGLWARLFGTSALALRSLSAAAFALACVFTGAAGRRAVDDRTGVVAALLVTASPIGLLHAATARPYALVLLCAAIAVWADAREDTLEGDGRAFTRVFVPHLIGLFTHPMFLFVSVASAAAHMVVPGRRRTAAIAPLAAAGVYAASWSWMLARTFAGPATSWIPRPSLRNLVSGYTHLWGVRVSVLLALLALGAVVVVWRRRYEVPGAVQRGALVAVGVLVAVFAVSQIRPVYLFLRTPVFVLPAASLAFAGLMAATRVGLLAPLAAAIVVVTSIASTMHGVRAGDPTPTRASLAVVAREIRCGDVIVAAGMSYAAVTYYAHDAAVPACVRIVPFPADVAVHPGWPDMRPGFQARLQVEAPDAAAALPPGSRVWLLRTQSGIGQEAGEAIRVELARRRTLEQRTPLRGSFFDEVLVFGPA